MTDPFEVSNLHTRPARHQHNHRHVHPSWIGRSAVNVLRLAVVAALFLCGGMGFGVGWQPFGFLPGLTLIVAPWPIIGYIPAIIDRRRRRGFLDRWAHTVVIELKK